MNQAASYSALNRRRTPAPSRSVIDAWLVIAGNLKTEGEILVEGEIQGDVRCIQLVIAADAAVTGNVVAEEVIVYGKVKGSIRAHRVVLKETSVVDADIYHRALTVERGACFDGSARRRDQPMAAEIDAQIEGLRKAALAMRHVEQNGQNGKKALQRSAANCDKGQEAALA